MEENMDRIEQTKPTVSSKEETAGKRKFTLRDICVIAGVEVPGQFSEAADKSVERITCAAGQVKEGDAWFERGLLEEGRKAPYSYNRRAARRAIRNGARFLFTSAQYYGEDGKPLPCIVVEEPLRLFTQLCRMIRDRFPENLVTVAITGSVGKTTTKEMLVLVAEEKYKTMFSKENANGFASIAGYMQQIKEDTEVYVQEAGAFYPGLVETEAKMLKPNACVITNVGTPHIDLYSSVDDILYDKLGLVRNLQPGGMAFLNMDDARLRAVKADCSITWFSASDPKADYFAENVEVNSDHMEFDIVGKGERTRVKVHSYGIHNIINSVAAFAFGRWMGIPAETLKKAIGKYKAVGLRQNLCNVGGYYLYIDCYNSAPNSVVGAIETILRIPVAEGNKRIAVLGDIPRMGEHAPEVHAQVGKELADREIDLYLCYGENMRYMADELKKAGRSVLHTNDRDQLNRWLAEEGKIGDLILFKAGHPSHLAKTVDQVYGTSFHITDGDVIADSSRPFKTEKFTGRIVDGMAVIRGGIDLGEKVTIPATIQQVPVYRIGSDAFTRKRVIKELEVSEGVVNIGVGAFYICTGLKKVTLPSTLKIIERSAFNYCTALEEIVLPNSVLSLGRRAFYDCTSLKKIVIGENTTFIDEEAFHNCKELTIYGVPGSYAESYAREKDIPFEAI